MKLGEFIFYRFMSLIGQIMGIVAFILALIDYMPYDPAMVSMFGYQGSESDRNEELARRRHELGIDIPVYRQYFNFFQRLIFKKSLGESWIRDEEVLHILTQALRYTFIVFGTAFLIYTPLAIIFGIISAKYHRRLVDNTTRIITTATYSIPPYILGIWLIVLSDYKEYSIFPIPAPNSIFEILKYSMLPIIAVILIYSSFQYRIVRNHMLEILSKNYIKTARAKGLTERQIIIKHALRNALPFIITSIAVTFPIAFSGVAILEVVFFIPGSGYLLIRAINGFDWPVIIGGTVLYTLFSAIVLATTDVGIFLVSPKQRHFSTYKY